LGKRKENQTLIKIICIVASFALWLYINGIKNPMKTDTIKNVHVDIVNEEALKGQGLVLLPEQYQDLNVALIVKGPASEINRLAPNQFKLEADVGVLGIKPGEHPVRVTIKQQPIGDYNVVITDLQVKVKFDKFVRKTVPVKNKININTKEDFTFFAPVTKPSEVYVSGAAQFVNPIAYVMAQADYKDMDKSIEASLPLRAYNEDDKMIDSDVVNIEPNIVDVSVSVKQTKTVPITVGQKGSANNNIILKSIVAIPDKIDIAGDSGTISKITSITTEALDLSTINEDKTVELRLIVPQNITLINSKDTINVKIDVDKIIEKSFPIDIKFNNLGEDYNMVSDKNSVSVTLSGTEARINALDIEDMACYVDLSNLGEGDHTVQISVSIPEGIKIIKVTPPNVKVTITKKDIPASTETGGGNDESQNNNETTESTTPDQ
jgi:YbbR domain-containing protein